MQRIAGITAFLLAGAALMASPALAAPPPNDDFANAEVLTATPASVAGTNVDATAEPDEPDHDGYSADRSVWFRWTAPSGGEVTIDTCDTSFDTLLAVYTGSTLATLDGVASNDTGGSCFSPGSEVEFEVTGGTTYSIAVDGWNGQTGTFDLELSADLLGPPGPGQIFYVRAGGTGTDCTQSDPCGTIADALAAHRVTSGPGDVIDVGPGEWDENVDAGRVGDGGLTIRGALSPSGEWETTINGSGGGTDSYFAASVALGTETEEVALRDVEVTNDNADFYVVPVTIGGSSGIHNVHAQTNGGFGPTGAVTHDDEEPGKVIADSLVEGPGAVGIWGDGGMTIRDSLVTSDYQAIQAFGCGCAASSRTTLVRSTVQNLDPGSPAMNMGADLVVDSSLVRGGDGIYMQGYGPSILRVENSTIDAGTPGVEDGGGSSSLEISNQNPDDPIDVDIDSSILVEPLEGQDWGAGGTIDCAFDDMPAPAIDPVWAGDCQIGQRSNVTSDPATLFTGGSPFSWTLAAGSPAIETGNPAPLGPGASTTDLAGDPRVVAHTTATCPGGIRDKGAYEHAGVDCPEPPPPPPPPPPAQERTLTVTTSGSGAGTVTGEGIDCGGEGHTDCSETLADGTEITLTATAEENSSFAGFGGDCAESPCTLAMSADRAVEAAFAPNGEADTWFVKRPRRPWQRSPVFTMRTWPHDSPLECRVDDGAWEACEARVKLRGLEPGRHVFRARSFAFGAFDPSPAKKRFRIPR